MGKYTTAVFTNNTNTEIGTKNNLPDERQCLTNELHKSPVAPNPISKYDD